MDKNNSQFPLGFFWGSATAAYQVEGGIENTDWAEGARAGKLPFAGMACDHYNLYEQDFDIAQSLGQNAHRFSIEWARIESEEGKFDENEIEHYRKVIRALRARGLEPFVTLWHFTLPIWFEKRGGFANKNAPKIFARYCEFVLSALGDEAKFWMTMNEPLIFASGGYLKAKWPPFQKNFFTFLKIFSSLAEAHRLAFDSIKKVAPKAQVGIAKHNIHFASDGKIWNSIASAFMTWFWNDRFLEKISDKQDFIGLNYYFHKKFGKQETLPKTDMGWDIFPEGLLHVLNGLKKYNKPVYITENGIADASDTMRAQFITDHIEAMKKAIENGVSVRGFFYWSLLDNFEWSFGFEKRFGLVEINYETQERKIRPSAFEYKKIIEQSML